MFQNASALSYGKKKQFDLISCKSYELCKCVFLRDENANLWISKIANNLAITC